MILIGQYDSPFVRRIGIALRLYGIAFHHRPWSAFGNAEALRALNPLMRVPSLVLDDGFVLTDSHMILDYLDSLVPAPMYPRKEPARHRAMAVAALACGVADKAVALFYERQMHPQMSEVFVTRCTAQINAALQALEADLATKPGPYWFGETLGHGDIAVVCALRFIRDVHAVLFDPLAYPALTRLSQSLESTPVFREISQPFVAPV